MDYIEIMDYCGYDLYAANEMAEGPKTLPEIIEGIMGDAGLERRGDNVQTVQSESRK